MLGGCVCLLLCSVAWTQDRSELENTLFRDVEKLLIRAQSEQANILSPNHFKKAREKYEQAQQDFERGRQLRDIQDKLKEAKGLLSRALETAELGQVTFASTLEAREAALHANAPEHAKETFEDAESAFTAAARELEQGDVKEAKKRKQEIERRYREAELKAIKNSIMGTVRNLMGEARKLEAHKHAPITFARAQKLLSEAEAILNRDRRSEASAQEKAEAAENEAKHAIYLTRLIRQLKDDPKQWENFFLIQETQVESIAATLGFDPTFDEGLEKPLNKIHTVVQNLLQEKKNLTAELNEKNEEIARLREELAAYQKKQEGLQAELQEKQLRLELRRQREEKIKSIEQMFDPAEAVVLRRGNDLIIRLIGLSFASGKYVIEPEFFSLLSKVQRAIRKFSNVSITIEGHTDSVGDERYNENLSYERALAVKQYLIANMGLDESRITAVGYGENRPIASNETQAGRAQNRRIDVVLTFSEELL